MADDRTLLIKSKASKLDWTSIECKQNNMISFIYIFNKKQYRINCWLKKRNKVSIRLQAKEVNVSWLNIELYELDQTLMMVNNEMIQPEGR